MVVLAIGAHPDDLELNCFGTLAKFVKQGHTVYTCTVCNGSLGSYVIEPEELAEMYAWILAIQLQMLPMCSSR